MTKNFILNIVLNLGIVFLVLSGYAAYNSGNMLILGLSIALMVVLIYFKFVLLRQVSRQVSEKQKNQSVQKTGQKKRAKK